MIHVYITYNIKFILLYNQIERRIPFVAFFFFLDLQYISVCYYLYQYGIIMVLNVANSVLFSFVFC